MEKLSPREHDIAEAVADGLTNKEIAKRLNIAEGTVKQHLHSIFQKLGVLGRVRLMALIYAERRQQRGLKE